MPVDVVVVTYNSASHLQGCLEALPAGASAIVVDNASADGSAELAEALGARVVRNAENVGFAAAANQGARAGSGELVCFLNPDAVLAGPDLELLRQLFDADPRLGAASPRLLRPDGSEQRAWWPFPTARGTWAEAVGLHLLRPPRIAADGSVPYLVGTCLCVRRTAYEEVGGFDERFWLYGEDADLGFRLAQAGWSSRYAPEAVVRHIGGASGHDDGGRSFEHFQRGAELFIEKHAGGLSLLSHRLGLLAGSAIRVAALTGSTSRARRETRATRRAIVRRLAGVLVTRRPQPQPERTDSRPR